MESVIIYKKNSISVAHLPTLGLLVGYLVYWWELYFFCSKAGVASIFASSLFTALSIITIIKKRRVFFLFLSQLKTEWVLQGRFVKACVIVGFFVVLGISAIALYAALLPPHLSQEFDALNYHLTVPRQHLILESFKHLEWSSADLFPLPINFALAPYWFVTELPNKVPQFLFLLGLVSVAASLVKRLSDNNFISICFVVFAIFGSHFTGIQMGTAMLDIVICYLFFAALDSFLRGNVFMSALEFTFFFWAKSFMPFQFIFIFFVLVILFFLFKKIGFKNIGWGFKNSIKLEAIQKYKKNFKKVIIIFCLLSVVIAGPFLVKATYYSGTPLFPFFPGFFEANENIDKNSKEWESLIASSSSHLRAKNSYGYGRSLKDFVKHFWLLAVPDKGVNNRYDYPVGLVYLIFLGPFLYLLYCSLAKKQIPILPLFIVVYWLTWWFGSQQSRFLYIPILLMFTVVLAQGKFQSNVFMVAIIFSLIITSISIFRAHKKDFGLSKKEILRPKDREIVKMNEKYLKANNRQPVYLDYYDTAFVRFPVKVIKEKLPWALYTNDILKSDK